MTSRLITRQVDDLNKLIELNSYLFTINQITAGKRCSRTSLGAEGAEGAEEQLKGSKGLARPAYETAVRL